MAFAPLTAVGQVNPDAGQSSGQGEATYKYEAYLGPAYTRFRQATESYSGLIGGKLSLARDWGKYFELVAAVDYYKRGIGHPGIPNPGHPSVYTALVGPGIHANLYGNLSGQFFTELGVEHTGGEGMTPNLSFAGGFGGGLTYNLARNLAVQLTADRVGASFSLENNTPQLAYSTHLTWNARATLGVVYRF